MTTKTELKIDVWSQNPCPWCDRVKNLIKSKGYTYTEKVLGENATKQELIEVIPGARSVPQVVINGEVVGGFAETERYLKIL
jgi:glutaredoxin